MSLSSRIMLPLWSDPTGGWIIVDRVILEGIGLGAADLSEDSATNDELVALKIGHDANRFIATWTDRFGTVSLSASAYVTAPSRDWPSYGLQDPSAPTEGASR